MKTNQLAKLLRLKLISLPLISVGSLIIVLFHSHYKHEVDFNSKAISTTGIVINTESVPTKNYSGGNGAYIEGSESIYTIRFRTSQGQSVEFKTGRNCGSICDTNVSVLYNPRLPSYARVDDRNILSGFMKGVNIGIFIFLFLILGVAPFLIGGYNLFFVWKV
jgi:hypothetical protein